MIDQILNELPLKNEKMAAVNILVIDDEAGFRALLQQELSNQGYSVSTASNGIEALEKIRAGKFQLAISDIKMPQLDGIGFLEAVKREDPNIEVIIATGFGTVETAVSAMKKGAYDFVQKPYNLLEVLALIEKAVEKSDLKAIIGVYEASKAIFDSINLEALLPVIMQLAIKIMRADDASLMLIGADGKLGMVACSGVLDDKRKETRLALGERVAGKVAASKEPVIISGPLSDDPRFAGVTSSRDVHSAVVHPLLMEGELLGVLNVNRTSGTEPFNSSDLCNATIFSSQIAQAVRNARLYEKLEIKIQEVKTAYERLEETQLQLVQSEKLAAIGQLAAGIAHELNNPLSGIMGFSEMVLQNAELPKQVRADIECIFSESQQCRKIIQNLLQFSRRRQSRKEPTALFPLLESTLQLLKYDLATAKITLEEDFPAPLPLVCADAAQLQQVFLNLITNARQAMENKTPAKLTLRGFTEGDNVVMKFSDTGAGISQENREKIFDPFFTTKPVGKGTGLGLSISYGIIKEHGGVIKVESEMNAGTTFTIELPIDRSVSE